MTELWNPQIGTFLQTRSVIFILTLPKRNSFVVSMPNFSLIAKAGCVRTHVGRHMPNSTGIWAQGDPNSRHKTASRPARSRGRQAMTPQCQDSIIANGWVKWCYQGRLKAKRAKIMTSMSCRATYQRFIPTLNRWLHGKVQYTTNFLKGVGFL